MNSLNLLQRRFHGWVGVGLVATAMVGLRSFAAEESPASLQSKQRPNILFCFADDWGRYAGAYAGLDGRPTINDVVKTPVIDRVAREGVLFRNAFVTSPSCTPCRSSLLSGQYFFRTGRGAILLGAQWDASIPSYPLMLRDAGYHIGKSYKVWSPGAPIDAPYGEQKYAYEKAGRGFCDFSENVTRLVKEGMSFEVAKEKMLSQVRDNFSAFLADRKPDQPFCFWFGPTLTHRKFEKGSGQALWGIEPDSLKGKLPKFMPDVPDVRADYTDYMGEIQAWDAGVGVLLEKLREIGELDNTLVVISGDHGMPGVPGGKCNLYDHGVNVGLIARGPGVKGGRIVDDFVNLMDIAPTFLDAGGVKIPEVMTGRSFMNVLHSDKTGLVDPTRTWVVTGRERHVDNVREGGLPYPHRALRTADFLYVRNFAPDRWPMGSPKFTGKADLPSAEALEKNTVVAFGDMDASPTKAWLVSQYANPTWQWHYDYAFGKRPGEQLFDLRNDPDQTVNVAADPKYAKTRADMEQRLMDELKRTGDPRLVDGGKFFETPPMAGPLTEPRTPAMKKRGKSKPPNVVIFLTDDLSVNDCSIYNPACGIRAPNMEKVAKAGMTFTQAFVASSACAPSRGALLTALTPARNGAMFNHTVPDTQFKRWPAYFQEAGYEVVAIGKVAHYATVQQYGFDYCSHFNYHQDDCIDAALAWLETRASSKPLCLFVGSNWPHVPWPEKTGYPAGTLPLPPTQIDTPETRQSFARYAEAVGNADRDLGLVYDAARKHLGENLLFLFSSDNGAQRPFAKWTCYDDGVHMPLVAVWPGQIQPGSRSGAMVSWMDFLPTCLDAVGAPVPPFGMGTNQINGRSFLSVLKGEATEHRDRIFTTHSGDGKMNEYPMRSVRTREWKYVRNLAPDSDYHTHIDLGYPKEYWDSWSQKAATSAAAKAIVERYHRRTAEELYDLKNDPYELRNLAALPEQASRLAQFRAEVDDWMKANGDQGLPTENARRPQPKPFRKNKAAARK